MANFCENCGSPLKNENKFCPNCGAPVKSVEASDSVTPVPPNPASAAQPTPENISSYIDSRAFYVGICASAAIPFNCDERTRPIYRLHMHGLPNRTTLSIEGGDGV